MALKSLSIKKGLTHNQDNINLDDYGNNVDTLNNVINEQEPICGGAGLPIMFYVFILLIILFLIYYFIIRKKKTQAYIDPQKMQDWKKERKNRKNPEKINVLAMRDNLEKSEKLWKELSKIVHEAKWINSTDENKKIAAHYNALINRHKRNYQELQKLKLEIEEKLLN